MPLSKARDMARKRKERAKIRLDKLLLSPQTLNPVQPKHGMYMAGVEIHIDMDADGNPIPDIG